MPDWTNLVRERMTSIGLSRESEEEIISELAAHLEDDYQDYRTGGLSESEASNRVLSEIRWDKLARGIRRATRKEESMNNRTQALWLPAIANLTVAAVLLMLLEKLGTDARMTNTCYVALVRLSIHHRAHASYFVLMYKLLDVIHLPWLLTLPLSATAGCLMARRAQAPWVVRLMVGLAPSLLWLAVFVAMTLEFALDRYQFPSGFPLPVDYFVLLAVGWVVLPAIPLLLGTLPFLKTSEVREA